MTTNSPNPVDGDVQALIADCLNDIEEIQYEISTYGDESGRRASKLTRQQIALASLTAEPGIFEWRFKETDCAPATGWIALPMERLEQAKQTFGDLVEYRFWFPTQPAQLLRPVVLPKKIERDDADGYWMHKSGRVSAVNAAYFNEAIKECAEALRQQGHEVKND